MTQFFQIYDNHCVRRCIIWLIHIQYIFTSLCFRILFSIFVTYSFYFYWFSICLKIKWNRSSTQICPRLLTPWRRIFGALSLVYGLNYCKKWLKIDSFSYNLLLANPYLYNKGELMAIVLNQIPKIKKKTLKMW